MGMMRRSTLASVSLGALAVMATAGSVQAQEAAESPRNTGEIVVTANKREQSINDVGLTITALGASALQERQIQSVDDIAKAVPGLTYTNSANNTPVYTLRGVGFYDTSLGSYPANSVYLDQVPLPFPILTNLTAFDLERIEVLKGPQGTLFGQNSTGGAINYIAAKPTSDFAAGADLTYGRFNDVIGNAFISGPLAPGLNARLAVRGERADEWQRSYTRDAKNGKTRQLAGRLLLDWEASSTLKFELNLNAWHDGSDPQAVQYYRFNQQAVSNTAPVLNYPRSPLKPRAADWSPENGMYGKRDLQQAALRGDWEFADGLTLTSITAYTHFKERGEMDQDGTALSDIDLDPYKGKIRSFSQELRVSNGSGAGVRWVVGANYSHDAVDYDERLLYADSSAFYNFGIISSQNYSVQRMKNYAGFGNVEWDITPTVTLKGGLRYTQSNRTAEICNHDGGDGGTAALFTVFSRLLSGDPNRPALGINDCFQLDENFFNGEPYFGKLKENNVSWRGGIDYKPNSDLLFYVNIAKGYKAGGFGNLNASSTLQYPPATQESIVNYEGGFKATLADRAVQVNGAVFYMDYKDKQLRSKLIDATFGVLDALINIPKSHLYGGELEVTARPTDGLSLTASAVYVKSKIDRYTGVNAGGVTADFAGSSVPFTPEWQVGANARYETEIGNGLKAFISPQLTYRSKTYAIVGETPDYKIGAFTLLDGQLGVTSDAGLRAFIWGKNITKKYYWTNVVAGQDTIVRYAARPATYGITVGYDF
ncbi:TonB-dependent receptor [Novosphingobium sp. 9U]|uniref:TonB-dependent receptor n=1 Tax=Novosphingobium sp. 9U TaxID=2653158 RepID=UPI0012EFE4CB|nr:TonB-dependent receptor [Novosphingobium sp. 9U]VWX47299.1 TonB-dependent receptor [Novosphingobium sp. 9U]